jgi:hypothetical protein
MAFEIKLNLSSSNDPSGPEELARILRALGDRIQQVSEDIDSGILDVNGNTVGRVSVLFFPED